MSKRFYVIISYTAVAPKGRKVPSLSTFFNKQPGGPLLYQDQFDRFRSEVLNRAGIVAASLARLGLKVIFLETQQLIELFYSAYNPDIAAEERLTDVENLSAEVVSASPPQPTPATAQPSPPSLQESFDAMAPPGQTLTDSNPATSPQPPLPPIPPSQPESLPLETVQPVGSPASSPEPSQSIVTKAPAQEQPKGSPLDPDPEVDEDHSDRQVEQATEAQPGQSQPGQPTQTQAQQPQTPASQEPPASPSST